MSDMEADRLASPGCARETVAHVMDLGGRVAKQVGTAWRIFPSDGFDGSRDRHGWPRAAEEIPGGLHVLDRLGDPAPATGPRALPPGPGRDHRGGDVVGGSGGAGRPGPSGHGDRYGGRRHQPGGGGGQPDDRQDLRRQLQQRHRDGDRRGHQHHRHGGRRHRPAGGGA
jgi:hypothetical protein